MTTLVIIGIMVVMAILIFGAFALKKETVRKIIACIGIVALFLGLITMLFNAGTGFLLLAGAAVMGLIYWLSGVITTMKK